ncbi:glycosyltransferase family 2 protein [Kluyvera georgiana]|uniref:glycosyltransferase family 2 protein n=1 Tax=Kluyvera georgiana TaxID=73098 RepID=UPI00322065E3
MINIVIPMAGAGSRFAKAGYINPKPLIEVNGVPMIKIVINNLRPIEKHRFIFIVQKDHMVRFDLQRKLKEWAPDSIIVETDGITEGAACTVLLAKKYIDNNTPLMIANSDQYIDISIDDYLSELDDEDVDGLIMTMKANDPKWSFVGLADDGLVNHVVEKEVISDEATVGIYNFKRGSDFVNSAQRMIEDNERVNGEFYVAPAYNRMINDGAKVRIYNIGSELMGMYGLGIPTDLELFLSLPVCDKALKGL